MSRKLSTALGMASLLAVLTSAGPLSAKPITGTPGDDVLVGTPQADRIRGLAGSDQITGEKGDDWLFGDEGQDDFSWANGDGHDRIDGGSALEGNRLSITAGQRLRLHFDALGMEPETPASGDQQVLGIRNLSQIFINATKGDDRLVISSDKRLEINDVSSFATGAGDDFIDMRRMHITNVLVSPGRGNNLIKLGKAHPVVTLNLGSFDDPLVLPDQGLHSSPHNVVERVLARQPRLDLARMGRRRRVMAFPGCGTRPRLGRSRSRCGGRGRG